MQDGLALLVAEVDIGQPDVALQFGICYRTIFTVRVLPRPSVGALVCLGYASVRRYLRVDEGDVTVVRLRLFVHESEDSLCARHTHDYSVYLLGELVDVSGELLCHIEERNENAYPERHS